MRHGAVTEDVAQTIQAKKTGGHSLNYMPAAMVPRTHRMLRSDEYAADDTASCLAARDYKSATDLVVTCFTERTRKDGRNLEAQEDVAYALTNPGDGGRTQENRVVVPSPLAFGISDQAEPKYTEDIVPTLDAKESGTRSYVAIGISNDPTPKFATDVMPPLQSKAGTDGHGGGRMEAITYHRNASCAVTAQDDVTAALRAEGEHSYQFIKQKMAVRRLTPKEDERLMGWPDDHTRWGADGAEMSDSTRYKMCGNGVVAPVAAWIARRIAAASR